MRGAHGAGGEHQRNAGDGQPSLLDQDPAEEDRVGVER